MSWDEDRWITKLLKSQRQGMSLALSVNGTLNELQNFIWRALKQGLILRVNYIPFIPHGDRVSMSSDSSGFGQPASSEGDGGPRPRETQCVAR